MTFKDLKKRFSAKDNNIIASATSTSSSTSGNKYNIFKDLPLWLSDIERHKAEDIRTKGYCCFNHIIGLPKKDGKELRIFDYEQQLVNALDSNNNDYSFNPKISTFFLRIFYP